MTAFTNLHPSTRREIIERLDKAANLIEQGWTQGAYARDANGIGVHPRSEDAVCWCLTGAIQNAMSDMGLLGRGVVASTVNAIARSMYGNTPTVVNDEIARDRLVPLRILRETKKRLEAQA